MKEGFTKNQQISINQSERKSSLLKNLISKEVFVEQAKNKRRIHSNSILNELKLSQKISHQDVLLKQQSSLKSFQKLRNSSLRALKNRNSDSEISKPNFTQQSMFQLSRFALDKKQSSSNLNQDFEEKNQQVQDSTLMAKDIQQPKLKQKTSIEEKTLEKNNNRNTISSNRKCELTVNKIKIKKKNLKSLKPTQLLSTINNKIRQIDIISKTFDQVNKSYNTDYSFNLTNYLPKKQKKFNLLHNFESKIVLRKNMITQRKNSLKKNTIIDYRYKAFPKRFKTEIDKENFEQKYEGLWNEDARKLKNYISGGYSEEKQEFSDFCDLQDYKKLKKNFRTFEQMYSNIKQDKDNPIGKMVRTDRMNPNILEVVCAMQKQQQIYESKQYRK